MVIFHSYVSLPESNSLGVLWESITNQSTKYEYDVVNYPCLKKTTLKVTKTLEHPVGIPFQFRMEMSQIKSMRDIAWLECKRTIVHDYCSVAHKQ